MLQGSSYIQAQAISLVPVKFTVFLRPISRGSLFIQVQVTDLVFDSLCIQYQVTYLVSSLVARIQDHMGIPFGSIRLLHVGRKFKKLKSLNEYNITNDASIYLVSRLKGGAKDWGASPSSQSKSFKDALKPRCSPLNSKYLSKPTFIMEKLVYIPSLEVDSIVTNLILAFYE